MSRKHTKYLNPSDPLVSILTPTYNRPEWLRLTLKSLIEQTYPKFEVLVVNDFGVDVQSVIDEFNDPRIKYYQNSSNLDLAATRNVAIEKSSGDYFVMLDDDDLIYKEGLEFRLSLIKKYNADVVYTHALKMFYEKRNNGYQYMGSSLYWHSENIKDLLLIQNLSPCNTYLWSRRSQEKAGLFDTSLKASEDWSHTVELRQHYEFFGTDIIDCACSFRTDSSQMSGSRTGFRDHLPYLYSKWRKYAENLEYVKNGQNSVLKNAGFDPKDYGLD